jgi:hypothetical protein
MTEAATTFLLGRIADCRAEIEKLRRAIELKEAELGAFIVVFEHVDQAPEIERPSGIRAGAAAVAPPLPPTAAEPAKLRPVPEISFRSPSSARIADRVQALLATGMRVAEIATEVGVSDTRVYQIRRKLELSDRAAQGNPPERKPATQPTSEETAAASDTPDPTPTTEAPAATDEPASVVIIENAGVAVVRGPRPGISFRGRFHEVRGGGAAVKMLAVLVRAAPSPVNRSVLHGRCHPGVATARADELLTGLILTTRPAVEALGLKLNDMKGIGVSVTGMDHAAA